MAATKLFHCPGTCSLVTMTALEQCGLDYTDEAIDLARGEQRAAAHLATNPRGKVPALLVEGMLLTENAAIVHWLHTTHSDAGLLPTANDAWSRAQILSDLFWIAAGWHPSVRANRMPIRWTAGDPAPVRERGKLLFKPLIDSLDRRLEDRDWWYGDTWSIADVYLYWCYVTAEEGEYDLSGLTFVAAHRSRVETYPAFQRAFARQERASERMLAR